MCLLVKFYVTVHILSDIQASLGNQIITKVTFINKYKTKVTFGNENRH